MSELAIDHLLDDKYRIVRLIGQGAWATVYEAVNVRIQRRVAIKVLNIELANRQELLTRFNREAEAATQIESPFVVTMFDAGTLPDNRPYIVMEFLEGENLGRRLERLGAISEEQAASYAIHILSGLADAHATGVLHRDIKPDNLVIVRSKNGEEILKLVDFGISKPSLARPEVLTMTKTDLVLGSPVYMSPEQARGTRHMDHRSDLYSVGVVLYEAITEQVPHDGDNFNDLMFKVALEDAPDPRTKKPDMDAAMADIIVKALRREPDARFQSAVEFRDELIAWVDKRGAAQPASPYVTSKMRVRAALEIVGDEDVRASHVVARPPIVHGLAQAATIKEAAPPPEAPAAPTTRASSKRIGIHIAIAAMVVGVAGAVAVVISHHSSDEQPVTTTTATPVATATNTTPEGAISLAVPVIPSPASSPSSSQGDVATTTAPPATQRAPIPAWTAPVTTTTTTTKPAPSASASAAPPVASAATSPNPTPTVSTVVEGRSVRTTF